MHSSSCMIVCMELINTCCYRPAIQSSVVAQPSVVTNPFGTLPAMPQMSIGRTGTSSSIQYGISSLPVSVNDMPSLL